MKSVYHCASMRQEFEVLQELEENTLQFIEKLLL